MRLSEAQIKEAILHPDQSARQAAVTYFSDSYSSDPEVMPWAIRAIEKYGRERAFRYIHVVRGLAQTAATVEWVLGELQQPAGSDAYHSSLSRLLVATDPGLILPHEAAILAAPGFLRELTPALQDRLRLLSWNEEQCWAELERIAEEGKAKHYITDVDYPHAERVIQALAELAGASRPSAERALVLLRQEIVEYHDNPMAWMECFVVALAGRMRLVEAIPSLVEKLHEEGELLKNECMTALAYIGTEGAALALAEDFPAAESSYRMFAAEALGHLRSDTAAETSLELLRAEQDGSVRAFLGLALLSNFLFEGVEPVRQMVLADDYDSFLVDLREELVAACKVMGASFPELDAWARETEEREREFERRRAGVGTRSFSQAAPKPAPRRPAPGQFPPSSVNAPPVRGKKVGRNDPCPCGSGKKFKVCCLRKE